MSRPNRTEGVVREPCPTTRRGKMSAKPVLTTFAAAHGEIDINLLPRLFGSFTPTTGIVLLKGSSLGAMMVSWIALSPSRARNSPTPTGA